MFDLMNEILDKHGPGMFLLTIVCASIVISVSFVFYLYTVAIYGWPIVLPFLFLGYMFYDMKIKK